MSDALLDAIIAWAGTYSPIAPSASQLPDISSKRLAFSTKPVAKRCIIDPSCPADACERKRSGRCVVRPDPSATNAPFSLNNSMTADLYRSVGVLSPPGVSPSAIGAPVLVSDDADVMLVPFRTGAVRARQEIQAEATVFLDELHAVIDRANVSAQTLLVLCGHSQGGALAQAVALELVRSSADARSEVGLERTFLVTSGAHLWMSAEEAHTLERAFAGRLANFVTAVTSESYGDDGAVTGMQIEYDDFAHKTHTPEEPDQRSVMARVLVSSSDTFDSDVREITGCAFKWGEDFECNHEFISAAPNMVTMYSLHPWEYYEAAIRSVYFPAYERVHPVAGGSAARGGRAGVVALSVAITLFAAVFS